MTTDPVDPDRTPTEAELRAVARGKSRPSEVVRYVILDPKKGGYACYDGIEGWHFTALRSNAAVFRDRVSAERVRSREFATHSSAFVMEVAANTVTEALEYKG